MAENKTLARPYARAIFAYADEHSLCHEWSQLLDLLAMIVSDQTIQPLLYNPNLGSNKLIDIMVDVVKATQLDIRPSIEKTLQHLLQLLAYNKRLYLLPAIASHFQELRARAENLVNVSVLSAQPLSSTQAKKMEALLAKRFNTNVDVTFSVSPELIGGMQVRKGNWVMDDSLLGKLKRLHDNLS